MSSDVFVLSKNWHLDEMKLLSSIDDTLKPLAVNEVTYDIDCDHLDAQWMQPNSSLSSQYITHCNSWPVLKTSILMPVNVPNS